MEASTPILCRAVRSKSLTLLGSSPSPTRWMFEVARRGSTCSSATFQVGLIIVYAIMDCIDFMDATGRSRRADARNDPSIRQAAGVEGPLIDLCRSTLPG